MIERALSMLTMARSWISTGLPVRQMILVFFQSAILSDLRSVAGVKARFCQMGTSTSA